MKFVKIEMVVRSELASSIIDLVKGDVSSLTMTMVGDPKPPVERRRTRVSVFKGGLPASAQCALNIMHNMGLEEHWTSSALGAAMHATKGYAASGGSATVSYLTKHGYIARSNDGRVHLTEKGWNYGKA